MKVLSCHTAFTPDPSLHMDIQFCLLILTANDALRSRLEPLMAVFQSRFTVFFAHSRKEAEDWLDEDIQPRRKLALVVVDESLPDVDETEFLIHLHADSGNRWAYKVLVLDEPSVPTLLQAINHGGLDYCFTGDWDDEQLVSVLQNKLTDFILEHRLLPTEDKMQFADILESERFFDFMYKDAATSWSHR